MHGKLGLIALLGTLATAALAGTASAHERRNDCGRYVEQENHQRRERRVRDHQQQERQENGWWIGRWR